MSAPTPSNALVNVLADWEDKNGAMAAIMPHEWAELMRPVMNACVIQSPRQLRAELAAAQALAEQNAKDAEALQQVRQWLNNGATIKARIVPCLVPRDDGSYEGNLYISYTAIDAARKP